MSTPLRPSAAEASLALAVYQPLFSANRASSTASGHRASISDVSPLPAWSNGYWPFIDAGTVSIRQTPSFSNLKVGAGVGLRYITPFGPLRIDAAVPLNRDPGDPRFGIYAGIGQAF